MSKRSERKKRAEERRKEKRKQLIISGIITGIFAIIMLVLGIIGFVNNRNTYMDYTKSEDVRTVDASVMDVEVHSRKDEYGKKYFYYRSKVSYSVDNQNYEGEVELDEQPKTGDIVSVKVYKTKKGEYCIPEVTNDTTYMLYNVLYLGVAIFGIILLVIVVIVLLPDRKNSKK
ncbi:MAG: hypothetical protein K6E10_04310 [Eubacterium sp.]|nr:hypothetical protein [Eubacterium sp.]